jgi:hypothetical protein
VLRACLLCAHTHCTYQCRAALNEQQQRAGVPPVDAVTAAASAVSTALGECEHARAALESAVNEAEAARARQSTLRGEVAARRAVRDVCVCAEIARAV